MERKDFAIRDGDGYKIVRRENQKEKQIGYARLKYTITKGNRVYLPMTGWIDLKKMHATGESQIFPEA